MKACIATSFVSIAQAEQNLEKEIADWDVHTAAEESRAEWNKYFSRIKIKGATEDQKTIFYSAMYHSSLFPHIFSEYGKYYSAFDDQIHSGVAYNDYSLWDTFRILDFLNDQIGFINEKYLIVDFSLSAIGLLIIKENLNYWYKSLYRRNQRIFDNIKEI